MFCSQCGNTIAAEDRFCRVCGKASSASPAAAVAALSAPQTSGKAIAALICGLFAWILPSSIAAVILGHLSLSEINKAAGRITGRGMAVAGLILGYAGLAIIPVLIIAAIAIPNLLRARMAANESSAVANVRRLSVAEAGYAESHRDSGYTCQLSDLVDAGLISKDLASGQKNGYDLSLANCSSAPEGGPIVKYSILASPIKPNNTGTRAFCSDESGVIRQDAHGSEQDCLEKGPVLQ